MDMPTLKWPAFTFSASASLSFSSSTDAAFSPCGPWPTIEVGPSVARSTPLTQLVGTSARAADDRSANAPIAALHASADLTGFETIIGPTPWSFLVVVIFFEADDMPLPSLLITG